MILTRRQALTGLGGAALAVLLPAATAAGATRWLPAGYFGGYGAGYAPQRRKPVNP